MTAGKNSGYFRRNSGRNFRRNFRRNLRRSSGSALLLILLFAAGILLFRGLRNPGASREPFSPQAEAGGDESLSSHSLCLTNPELIPDFSGEDAVELNHNLPSFTAHDLEQIQGESYSELDALGRCGTAAALLHRSLMPEGERQRTGSIRPSGWHTVKYPGIIPDNYLYNRCHLIAYAMTGQNDNPKNLITGTRYLNTEGMLPFEIRVLRYLDDSDNHVLYRVTPYFKGNDLVARGVEMEALSVEDQGKGLSFHVFVYNYQPGIRINYLTGYSIPE